MSSTIKNAMAVVIMVGAAWGLVRVWQNDHVDVCGDACHQHQYTVQLETALEAERMFANTLLAGQACAVDVEEMLADEAGGLVFTYTDEHRQDTYEIVWVQSGIQDQTGRPLNLCTDQPWPAVPSMP